VSGKPDQYDDLEAFIREQELFRRLVAASGLPWREFDVTNGDLSRIAEEVADWLEQTGGLWMRRVSGGSGKGVSRSGLNPRPARMAGRSRSALAIRTTTTPGC
jgi:hypothetical protein